MKMMDMSVGKSYNGQADKHDMKRLDEDATSSQERSTATSSGNKGGYKRHYVENDDEAAECATR